MNELREQDAPAAPLGLLPGALCMAAVFGIAYWGDRKWRRWVRKDHAIGELVDRAVAVTNRYREKKTNAVEVVSVFGEVVAEVARAASATR